MKSRLDLDLDVHNQAVECLDRAKNAMKGSVDLVVRAVVKRGEYRHGRSVLAGLERLDADIAQARAWLQQESELLRAEIEREKVRAAERGPAPPRGRPVLVPGDELEILP